MENYTVNNTLTIHSSEPSDGNNPLLAIQTVLEKSFAPVSTTPTGALQFATQWEPPLKEFAEWARQFPQAKMELIGEAFVTQHWICVATAENGKTTADTLTRIDGAKFESAFKQVFNQPFHEWEKTH
jgi:hypothetical protein